MAAYSALISIRFIGLDKHHIVRPMGVGETWQSFMAKCVLKVAGQEAKEVCGTDQFSRGMEVGIKEGIHAMRLMWQ